MVVLLSDSKQRNINGCYPSHMAAICISRDSQSRNIDCNIASFYCNTLSYKIESTTKKRNVFIHDKKYIYLVLTACR